MNTHPQVEAFFTHLDHPLAEVMLRIREIILSTDDRMTEVIKWGAPTFVYQGNLATFNVRAKKFVNLTFHTGALIPGEHSVLEGDGKEARVMRFVDVAEVEAKKAGLQAVVRSWIELKEGE